MSVLDDFRQLTRPQRHAFVAALAGWALDAFDFFIFVFAQKAISAEFHADGAHVALGLTLTLAMRPLGALVFGWLAERYGRRPMLMLSVVSYSIFELASAFAPSLGSLLVLRALFGFAMGGEWGIGAALALETLPVRGRGTFSGFLQEGYVIGYLLAALLFAFGADALGWRGMFMVGAVPALVAWYVRRNVEESPVWLKGERKKPMSAADVGRVVVQHWGLLLQMVVLMACFNAFSHGSQDLYPRFLQTQHGFDARTTGLIAVVYNLGALLGGITFGRLSERHGRKRTIRTAALLALPMIPLWAYSSTPAMFALGGFLMQFMVQGAWGIVPAHLNELAPARVRAILPGFAYQLGNFAMSPMGPLQAGFAERHGNNYALVLAVTLAVVALCLAVVISLGSEATARDFGADTDADVSGGLH